MAFWLWMVLAAVAIGALIGLMICLWISDPSDLGTDGYQLVSDVGFRPVDVDADLEMIAEIRRNLGTQEETDG